MTPSLIVPRKQPHRIASFQVVDCKLLNNYTLINHNYLSKQRYCIDSIGWLFTQLKPYSMGYGSIKEELPKKI